MWKKWIIRILLLFVLLIALCATYIYIKKDKIKLVKQFSSAISNATDEAALLRVTRGLFYTVLQKRSWSFSAQSSMAKLMTTLINGTAYPNAAKFIRNNLKPTAEPIMAPAASQAQSDIPPLTHTMLKQFVVAGASQPAPTSKPVLPPIG